VLASGAAGSTQADPGVTSTMILIGGAEAESASVRGAAAYFRYVNARGGVHGRSIVFRLDDAGVFARFGSLGDASPVPQLFVDSGSTALARSPDSIGFRPSWRAEGWILGSYLARARRGARVGVLHSDDERGRELLAGLRQGIARSTVRVAATGLEADPVTDVEALQAAGADVLALFVSTPRDVARAATGLGWRPLVLVGSEAPGGIEGAVSTSFVKDPGDPEWRYDPGLRRHRSVLVRADQRFVEGMAAAYELVGLLKAAGKEPTRAAVLAAARKLNDASNPFLLPGIVVRTAATDRFPLEQAQLRRWSKGRWRGFGGLWRYPGG
jgi:branched-chain amino acid transport system substrate-binding protein